MYFIVDLEATCWEVSKVPDLNEIIDIGIVVCDDNYNILDSWTSFVKPKINTKLSGFCKKLTSIKQNDIDSALYLSDVINNFISWFENKFEVNPNQVTWCTWGSWDLKCLTADCNRNGILFPFSNHRNLKDIYYSFRNCDRSDKISLKEVILRENIAFNDKLHRGITDAFAAAKIAKLIFDSDSSRFV